MHQYDCFTPHRPTCDGGQFVFHNECVGPRRESVDGHPFDTLPSQIARNGHAGKPLLMKMDIEGAEWESLKATPDEVLDTFVQFPMELHLRAADESADSGDREAPEAPVLPGERPLQQLVVQSGLCSASGAGVPGPVGQPAHRRHRSRRADACRAEPVECAGQPGEA